MAGLALSALVGLLATIGFVSVSWPGESSRFVFGIVIVSGISFLASASIAIFAAATPSVRTTSPPAKDENLDSAD